MTFLDCLWKQKSEEEEKEKENSLHLLMPYCLPKETPIRQQVKTVPSQPTCDAEDLYQETRTPEQVLMQIPSRSFPTFQTLTNMPIMYKAAPGSHRQQERSQLFWGLPSLHSESLEAIILSSGDSSPLQLSVSPSALFNKLIFASRSNLLLPPHCSLIQHPNQENVEGTAAPDSQQLSSSPSPSVPLLPLPIKHFPMEHKEILCGAEHRRVSYISEDQVLHPQSYLQRTKPSTPLPSSMVLWGVAWDPSLQHIPDSISASLLYPSSHLGILTKSDSPRKTKGQKENTKVSDPVRSLPSSIQTSLPEFQGEYPIKGLFSSHVLWETIGQNENQHIAEPSILAPCKHTAPMTVPQESCHLGTSIEETRWASIGHKKKSQASKSTEGRLFALMKSWKHRENPQSPESLVLVTSPPYHQSTVDGGSVLGNVKFQGVCRENTSAFEPPALNQNPRFYGIRSSCVPSGVKTLLKGMQSQGSIWVSADSVSTPSLLLASALESLKKIPKVILSESKALQTKESRENLWISKSLAPNHNPYLAPPIEAPRIYSVGGLPKLDTAWNDSEHSRNSWAFQPLPLAFSSPPVLVLESPQISPIGIQLDSEGRCGETQEKRSCVSEPLTYSSPQYPHDRPLGVLEGSEPVLGDREQKEMCYVPMSQLWNLSPLLNPMSKFNINEFTGDQPNCKLECPAVEQKENCVAELPISSSFSVPLSNSDNDHEFVFRNVHLPEFLQRPRPAKENSLQPIPWFPSPEIHKIEYNRICLPENQILPEAEMEALPSQGENGPQVATLRTQAWHWSRQMELKLQKLQKRPTSRSFNSSQSVKFLALGSTPSSWGLSSCSPEQTQALIPCPHSPSYHSLQIQSTEIQPVKVCPSSLPLSSSSRRMWQCRKEPQTGEKNTRW